MNSLTAANDLHRFLEIFLLSIGALLPIVDPLGNAPIYLAATAGLGADQREQMAKAVALNSFLLLIASTLVGVYVLDFFGVSIPAVQVAGGIMVCAIAWAMLNDPNTPAALTSEVPAPPMAPDALSQKAFYPLTMPLTVGPGSISVALTLGANSEPGVRSLVITSAAHLAGILVVTAAIYLCYRYADRILQKLGATGSGILVRLSAFILLCIGVQICWNGVHGLITGAFPGLAAQ
jgi:multiple antibiotic resistance protein